MQYVVQPALDIGSSFAGPDPNKVYTLTSILSPYVMSIRQAMWSAVELRRFADDPAQQWRFVPLTGADSGYYKIVNVGGGGLGVAFGVTDSGTGFWAGGDGSLPASQFRVIWLGGNRVRIEVRHTGMVLTVQNGSTAELANLVQQRWIGDASQRFLLGEVQPERIAQSFGAKATIYQSVNFTGASKQLGPGAYTASELGIGVNQLSSLKVPDGLRVTLYENKNWTGRTKTFDADASSVGDDFNDLAKAAIVEVVATLYEEPNYAGRSIKVAAGMSRVIGETYRVPPDGTPGAGSLVVIQEISTGKLVRVGAEGTFDRAGADTNTVDNTSTFELLRTLDDAGNAWVGFKSLQSGLNLQMVPANETPGFVLRWATSDFYLSNHTREHFRIDGEYIYCQSTGGYVNDVGGGLIRGYEGLQQNQPAGKLSSARFRVIPLNGPRPRSMVSIRNVSTDKYWQVGAEGDVNRVGCSGTRIDKSTLFELKYWVHASGQVFIGFRNWKTDGQIEVVPATGVMRANSQNFASDWHAGEHFRCETGSIISRATGAAISPRSDSALRAGFEWRQIAGSLKCVSASADGAVWGVGPDDAVYRRSGDTWERVAGALKQVSVSSFDNVLGVNSANNQFHFNGTTWDGVAANIKQVAAGADGTAWGVSPTDQIMRWTGQGWVQEPGALIQISTGGGNLVWGVNFDGMVFRWDGQIWERIPGTLSQVSVGADGEVWGVNAAGSVFRWDGATWVQAPGTMKQIAVGSAGLVWGVASDNTIWQLQYGQRNEASYLKIEPHYAPSSSRVALHSLSNGKFLEIPTGAGTVTATSSSVGSSSTFDMNWIFDSNDRAWLLFSLSAGGRFIEHRSAEANLAALSNAFDAAAPARMSFRFDRNALYNRGAGSYVTLTGGSALRSQLDWELIPGALTQVSVADDGTVIGVNANNAVFRWQSGSWESLPGTLKQVWVRDASEFWGVSPSEDIFRWKLGAYTQIPGKLRQVSVAADGTVWGVNAGDVIFRFNGSSWDNIPGLLRQIAIGSANLVWGVNAAGNVFSFRNGSWQLMSGTMRYVHVSSDGQVFGLAMDGAVQTFDGVEWYGRQGGLTQIAAAAEGMVWGVNSQRLIFRASAGTRTAKARFGLTPVTDFVAAPAMVRSMKVPAGMIVTVPQFGDQRAPMRHFTQDTASVPEDYQNLSGGVGLSAVGMLIPQRAVKFGCKLALRSRYGKYCVQSAGTLRASSTMANVSEQLTLVRSGATKHSSYLSFGDVVSLRAASGQYVTAEIDGRLTTVRTTISASEQWVITRAGPSASSSFVCAGDVIALKSLRSTYLTANADGSTINSRTTVSTDECFTLRRVTLADGVTAAPQIDVPNDANSPCGADVCGTQACGQDACGAAACGTATSLVGACAVAASGIAVCALDVCGAAACGAAACGAAIGGIAACGADACGVAGCGAAASGASACVGAACGADACVAAACGAAACGAAACGAAACGAAVCAVDACGADACGIASDLVDACGAKSGAIDACPADFCGANACGINMCAADACAADACGIDIVPIIPGI